MNMIQMLDIVSDYNSMQCDCFVCGGQEFPYMLAQFTSTCVTIVKVMVPILLIILGVLDMLKATSSQKEDEMKKAQQIFVKRLISALLVFFVVALVQFAFGVLNKAGFGDAMSCVDSFVNGGVSKVTCNGC